MKRLPIKRWLRRSTELAGIAWHRVAGRERCWLCGAANDTGILCLPCLASLPALTSGPPCPAGISDAFAAFEYRFPVDRLVQAAKYHADFAAQRAMAASMTRQLRSRYLPFDHRPPALLVPIPLHAGRQRRRGFNQAQRLATALARERGDTVAGLLLQRCRAAAAQSGSNRARRLANVRHAFSVPPTETVPAEVILVDDVITTGATAASAARALRAAGVQRVALWCYAWAPPGSMPGP